MICCKSSVAIPFVKSLLVVNLQPLAIIFGDACLWAGNYLW